MIPSADTGATVSGMEPLARTDVVAGFADRLGEAVERKHSQLLVGLDPRLDLLPMELRGEAVLGRAAAASAIARFCKGIIDAVVEPGLHPWDIRATQGLIEEAGGKQMTRPSAAPGTVDSIVGSAILVAQLAELMGF